jgi:sulfide:quinone oxidoreductase
MSTTLILGGGFGGLACARALAARAPRSHRILLLDRSRNFLVGAAKTWVMLGERRAEEAVRERSRLVPPRVTLIEDEVRGIDAERREARTTSGTIAADQLVLALGADLDLGAVPGLAQAAQTFYTVDGAVRLRAALGRFSGGRIVILIPRAPFKCPPAPYEAAMMLHAALERRGIRLATQIEVWTVEKQPMPTAGPEMGKLIAAELSARGIGFHPGRKAVAVEGERGTVRFEDGAEIEYRLLIVVPPHRAPRIVVEAGLAEPGGWIAVDPATMAVKKPGVASEVYAIGDLASVPLPGRWAPEMPLVLPKAGVFAAAQGEAVGARIAAALNGEPAIATFGGQGHCYIEVGGGRAMRGDGTFFATPHPVMTAREPDEAQYRDKLAWVESWLTPPA